ncbi:MAG: cytochrome c biogenesis protein CcsA [Chloroflexi bacterium]|nr:cytochrome c biogenesis protein CcsA [Chloroflexota bacterium]MDA1227453.1 cytochrome c biogenesis protein CcsA [Chloroflexota bacterium]
MTGTTEITTSGGPEGRSIGSIVRYVLFAVSAVMMAVTLYMVFFWVPTELNLGVSQRIFYFHVPLGWLGMLSIMVVAVASIMHLITGKAKWDDMAYSTAELGVLFATLILVTGSIWARGDLGWWWTWDAKLTTTLVLWFIYVGYLMVRAYSPKGSQGARYGSVVALIGAVDAPIIYMATVWWRTAHPELNVGPVANEGDSIGSSKIYITLLVSTLMFTTLYIYMLIERYSMRRTEAALDEVHQIFN